MENPLSRLDTFTLANVLSRCHSKDIAALTCVDKYMSNALRHASLLSDVSFLRSVTSDGNRRYALVTLHAISLRLITVSVFKIDSSRVSPDVFSRPCGHPPAFDVLASSLHDNRKLPCNESRVYFCVPGIATLALDCDDLLHWKLAQTECFSTAPFAVTVGKAGGMVKWDETEQKLLVLDAEKGTWVDKVKADSRFELKNAFPWKDGSTCAAYARRGRWLGRAEDDFRVFVVSKDGAILHSCDTRWVVSALLPRLYSESVCAPVDNVAVTTVADGDGDVDVFALARDKTSGWIFADVWIGQRMIWGRNCVLRPPAVAASRIVRYVRSFCCWGLKEEGRVLVVGEIDGGDCAWWLLGVESDGVGVVSEGYLRRSASACRFGVVRQFRPSRRG